MSYWHKLACEPENLVVSDIILTFVEAKPRFQDGEFTVEYKQASAILSWPALYGYFTRQTIQKRINKGTSNQAITECDIDFVEEDVPLNQTSHTTNIDPDKTYEFRLLLFDGNVVVQSWEGPVTKAGILYEN